jgi:hypothetical protein
MAASAGFFFVAAEELHLQSIKVIAQGGDKIVSVIHGKMTPDCKDNAQEVAVQIFGIYELAAAYQQQHGGKIYHCIPHFTYSLSTALEICGISETGHLISIGDAIEMRVKHFEEHCGGDGCLSLSK